MRRAILAAIPILGLTLMLQLSILSRMMLLSGNADLILLVLAAWALQERARGAWIWGVAASLISRVDLGDSLVHLPGGIFERSWSCETLHPPDLAGPTFGHVYGYIDRYIGVTHAYLYPSDCI